MSRKFDSNGLTHSVTHHLLAVDEGISTHGYARVTDIARLLEVTRGSVSVTMQSLKNAGLVEQDENRFFHLTEDGRSAVASIRKRHQVVEEFMVEVLGLTPEQSHCESCRLENLLEAPTTRRLHVLLEFWRENGFADTIERRMQSPCAERRDPGQACPCCGLECIDGECPLKAGSTV